MGDTRGGARWVDAVFYNELTSTGMSVQPLLPASTSETLNGTRVLRWTGQAGGVSVTPNTGVVIVTSRNTAPIKTTGFANLQQLCAQTPVVHCYGGNSASGSLALLKGHGGLGVGTAGAAVLRDVTVNAGTCTQDQSAGYFVNVAGCAPQVEAVVDFGLAARGRSCNDQRKDCARGFGLRGPPYDMVPRRNGRCVRNVDRRRTHPRAGQWPDHIFAQVVIRHGRPRVVHRPDQPLIATIPRGGASTQP